ncbi:SDR family NAD(P)-dependent oxidoreductase [Govanella unica]|uniref:SDR family NAD(P)-dependent oxidoreductase n=1 Tax=Govanella unica TaxID=2975056 RepID=A0A9X3Z772_9PROT|nr:SDR family NAD(P)-dependent oxidoreductase [Govania unica]MDA5193847.1 SDR family NAD(P)-dependent oxidoreductase [Govania unica]
MTPIRFDNRVAIVTGAGLGLGRAHALALAARGAKVVVNDFGGSLSGEGGSEGPAEKIVAEIRAAGGEAIANTADVTNFNAVTAMVLQAMDKWGRVDILVNNAGVLRDKSFNKMTVEDFSFVVGVHLMGSVHCSKAVWDIMRDQNYGRICMTSSPSGLYGNYGQSNYSAAKMAVIGLMNTLHIEGAKHDIRVNTLVPAAATRMTEGLMPDNLAALLRPEAATAGMLTLVDENAPNHYILSAAGGGYARCQLYETDGIFLAAEDQTPENIRAAFAAINDPTGQKVFENGMEQAMKLMAKAAKVI